MTATISIEAKVLGQRNSLVKDRVLVLPPTWEDPSSCIPLRDLLTHIVRQEVATFRERQERQRLLRVLTQAQIREGAVRGRIAMGGRDLEQEVDPEGAVEAALQAFEDRLYFCFVDGEQRTALDERVRLGPDSKLTFIRLVALAGG